MKKCMFIAIPAIVLVLAGCRARDKQANGNAIKILAATPTERVFRDIVRVQGMIESRQSATVAALVPGTLDAIFVDKGATVTNRQAMFQTDKVNLEQRLDMERQNQKVAEASVIEADASLLHAKALDEKASADHERFRALYENDKVVAKDAYERIAVAHKQASAGLAHARAVVTLANARKEQAGAALRIAEKQLADSLALAPFDGVVGERFLEPGEYAGAGAKVLTLKGATGYEARGHLAAAYLSRVNTATTRAVVATRGRVLGDFPVTLSSPTIDFGTRTFEVRVALTNGTDITDGMACQIALVLAERTGLGVPTRTIGLRNGKPVVFVVEGGLARQTPVTRGIVEDEYTELVDADNLKGKSVVIEGQSFLNDNSPVRTE